MEAEAVAGAALLATRGLLVMAGTVETTAAEEVGVVFNQPELVAPAAPAS